MCIMSICSSSTIIVLSALGDWTYDYESCPELTTHCGVCICLSHLIGLISHTVLCKQLLLLLPEADV